MTTQDQIATYKDKIKLYEYRLRRRCCMNERRELKKLIKYFETKIEDLENENT